MLWARRQFVDGRRRLSTDAAAPRRWHLANWGALGWTETALKLTAAVIGVAALVVALGDPLDWAGPARGGQVGILGALAIGLTVAIADRVMEREILALVFVLVLAAAHWCMVIALGISAGVEPLLGAFAGLMLAGELVKLTFLATSDFTVRDLPRGLLFALTSIYAIGYAFLLILIPF